MSSLIILHGWGHSEMHWKQVSDMFTDTPVVMFDLPGFGVEPLVSADWGVPEYARWVKDRIEKAGHAHVTLMGHSFGGRIAAHIAASHPEWLERLILVGAPCLYRPSLRVRLIKRIAKMARLLGMSSSSLMLNSELTEAQKKGMGDIYKRVVSYDQSDELSEIHVPTHIIRGELDTYPDDEVGHAMCRLIQDSSYDVLPGVGHNIHLENSTLLYGVIKKYINRT